MLSNSQKGITLYLVIVILAVVLAVAVGLSTILISQIKMITGMGNSVKALYAADTGIERVLKVILADEDQPEQQYPETELDNGAKYEVNVFCCYPDDPDCVWSAAATPECPFNSAYWDEDCEATEYCVRSVGSYEEVKRAIEVEVYPLD